MNKLFENIGEYYGAGLFEEPEVPLFVRFARAVRRYLENREMPSYGGEALYPCGVWPSKMIINHNYSYTANCDYDKLREKDENAADAIYELLERFDKWPPKEHSVGGGMYTHSIPNFGRIVKEGLDSYRERIDNMKNEDMKKGLTDVVEGIRSFHTRSLGLLKENGADQKLITALERVPFMPATTLYEALVCWNFMYYMDGCDNIGRLDADLIEYYKGEDAEDIIRCFFKNVDANDGWTGALGPDYNPLTIQCLKASKGIRRPSVELRVTPQMPKEVWDAAIDSIKAGGGSPSLYNEELYQASLKEHFPEIPKEDLMRFCGGGCTETMLAGICNVGSLDAGVNLALIFENFMRKNLANAETFEAFYKEFIEESRKEIKKVLNSVSLSQKVRAETRPHPMRTLLIDDCIAKEKDYNAGGARYYWSVVNIAGMINVIDSLSAINKIVFTDGALDGKALLEALESGETFLNYPGVPRHGTDSDKANQMAKRLSGDICDIFTEVKPYLGGRFLPSSIQSTTYTDAGKDVGATPDGRCKGAPLCDCVGAIFGNDTKGVTSLLNSASAICQDKMIGTAVLNVKLNAGKPIEYLEALVKGYFENGGMQMQVTCVNKEDMLNAQKEPEKYPNLIVRIGGYSEYFTRLSPELQQTVIERTVVQQ